MNVSIENPEVTFGQLKPGHCFIAGGVYLKTDSPDWPALALETGILVKAEDVAAFTRGVRPIFRVTLTRDVR